MKGRRYRDRHGVVHETRRPGMTILRCEERDGHRDCGMLVSDDEDPTVEVVTCFECIAA